MPGDSPSSLEVSDLKHNETEVRWKTCALWNGPQIGYAIKACDQIKGSVQKKYKPIVYVLKYKPIVYVLNSFHKICLNIVGVTKTKQC